MTKEAAWTLEVSCVHLSLLLDGYNSMSCPEVESSDQRCNTLQRIEELMVVPGP